MKNLLLAALLMAGTIGTAQTKEKINPHGYPINPVPFTSVKVTDAFWGQRLKASREVTIPLAFSKCEETGRYENFVPFASLTGAAAWWGGGGQKGGVPRSRTAARLNSGSQEHLQG